MSEIIDFHSIHAPTWCPGCGDFGIWSALKRAFVQLQWGNSDVTVFYGIGCHGHMINYLKSYAFDGLHGRPLPVAEGAKLANKDLNIVVVAGDGDTFGEGTNHLMHAARRNHNITMVLHDNHVYGLTTGQTAPTASRGFKTKSTPFGVLEEAINPIAFLLTAGATFIARSFAGDIEQTAQLIELGARHRGFSFIDVYQPCVSFNHVNTYKWYREHIYKLHDHDSRNKLEALRLAFETDKLATGIIYEEDRNVYEDDIPQTQATPLVKQPIANDILPRLIEEFK